MSASYRDILTVVYDLLHKMLLTALKEMASRANASPPVGPNRV
jgi:hypothetical protein